MFTIYVISMKNTLQRDSSYSLCIVFCTPLEDHARKKSNHRAAAERHLPHPWCRPALPCHHAGAGSFLLSQTGCHPPPSLPCWTNHRFDLLCYDPAGRCNASIRLYPNWAEPGVGILIVWPFESVKLEEQESKQTPYRASLPAERDLAPAPLLLRDTGKGLKRG